jgi:hypothetical protein
MALLEERGLLNGKRPRRVAKFHYSSSLRKVRIEPGRNGRPKEFIWEHLDGKVWTIGDGGIKNKPLYTNCLFRESDRLGIVIGFEGEAKADLAGELGYAAFSYKDLTTMHCPELSGFDVFLWCDKDESGIKQCDNAAKILHESQQPRSIRMISPPTKLPDGGDIVDAVRVLGWGRSEIDRLIAEARGWQPSESPTQSASGDSSDERDDKSGAGGRESAATAIVNLARSSAELFHCGEDSFATIQMSGHQETWPIRSRGFGSWLGQMFFDQKQKAATREALKSAVATLEGFGLFKGIEQEVFVRVAGDRNHVWVDLCDAQWQQVEIGAAGWRIVQSSESPMRFRRAKAMLPLPVPERGGSLNDLRRFVNVGSEEDFCLLSAFCICALRPVGPYIALILHGEQGSAKSTTTRVLRSLIDPNSASVRSEPREPRDLMIAANNGWMVAFDNISRLDPWLSDSLCRLSTGGGFSTRTLYSDAEETIFQAQRPLILNGIEELATRGDLLDRCIVLDLPKIEDAARMDEQTFNREFEAIRGKLFGALLDAVSAAIRNHDSVVLDEMPRMADCARWVTAAEPLLGWETGRFLCAYRINRRRANELALETPLGEAIRNIELPRTGTATELLKMLSTVVDEGVRKQRGWPMSGRALSNALRRHSPNFGQVGVLVEFMREPGSGRRLISLAKDTRKPSSRSSQTSQKASDAAGASHTQPQENSRDTMIPDECDVCDDERQLFPGASASSSKPNVQDRPTPEDTLEI